MGSGHRIPIKFMVPFLDQASLEDPNSILVDLWANLLASASENFNSQFLHFINIISHISSEQGVIFREITDAQDLNRLEHDPVKPKRNLR
jgi:hypothetical protein